MSAAPALRELPLGAVRPAGWLARQLRLQAEGQTGQLEEIWADVGPNSAWLGGTGEDWERGPYYVDGLLPLAHLLDDQPLKAKAQRWIEAFLGSQRDDGQFGPLTNDDWWPRMVVLKVLTQYADATGDERVVPFLERYFRFQAANLPARPLSGWGRARGADNVLSVLWLHERTGATWLVGLAQLILQQTADWTTFLTRDLQPGPASSFSHLTHGPNVAMGLKTPAMAYLLDFSPRHRAAVRAMLSALEELHGQVHGVFSGDEWLGGRDPQQGVETCQVVELMFSLEQLARVFGDGDYGDRLEQVAFNLLAASNDPRMTSHQYHQQANQVLVSVGQRVWSFSGDDANLFGHEPHYGCCTANLHQGWPKFARSLWMTAAGGALTAVAYAPCTVRAQAEGHEVTLEVKTEYPFEETVRIRVDLPQPGEFSLRLRIPGWCESPSLAVGSEALDLPEVHDGYVTVRRRWRPGDEVRLSLPMRLRTVPRDRGAVGVRLGPLVLAFAVGEVWRPLPDAAGLGEWEVTPRSWWNLGLWLDAPGGIDAWRVERRAVGELPFAASGAPVVVHAKGAPVREWQMAMSSAAAPPQSPVATGMPILDLRLLPYGCARLRVAEMPVVLPVGTESM